MNSIKLIIFDLDDTLIKTYENMYIRVKLSGKKALNKEISKEEFDKYYGVPGFDNNMKKLFNTEDINSFLTCFENYLNEYQYEFIVDMNKIMDLRSKGIRLGIISNSLKQKNKKKIEKNNFKNYFDFIYSFEDLEAPKPDKKIIEKIISNMDLKKCEIVYVGDDIIDKNFADNAKLQFIPVNTGKNKWKGINYFETVNDFLNKFLENY